MGTRFVTDFGEQLLLRRRRRKATLLAHERIVVCRTLKGKQKGTYKWRRVNAAYLFSCFVFPTILFILWLMSFVIEINKEKSIVYPIASSAVLEEIQVTELRHYLTGYWYFDRVGKNLPKTAPASFLLCSSKLMSSPGRRKFSKNNRRSWENERGK